MSDMHQMSADEVIAHLDLELLEGEGCWYRLLWNNGSGNAIYGMVTPREFSALHVLAEDELWVHVAGDPVDLLILHPDGSHQQVRLGKGAGQTPSVLVPAGSWQGASVATGWGLFVCALAPAFTGFALATPEHDFTAWAQVSGRIKELIRG